MPTRQYIGARYVPKFFENSDGSSEWMPNTQYEPLTIVTLNGNSYTSKKYVPANVGSPAINREYWASTGLYNAQVEAIRQGLELLSDNVEEYEDINNSDYVIFIGDSYGLGSTDGGRVTGWCDYAMLSLGKTINVNAFKSVEAGAGFGTHGTSGNTFTDLLTVLANTMDSTTKRKVKNIVVCGGINDANPNTSVDWLLNKINDFMIVAKSNYPNAKVHIGSISTGYGLPNNQFNGYYYQTLRAYERSGRVGASYIGNTPWIIHDKSLLSSDHVHLTEEGYRLIGDQIANYLNGGNIDIEYRVDVGVSVVPLHNRSDVHNYPVIYRNGVTKVPPIDINFIFTTPVEFDVYNYTDICDVIAPTIFFEGSDNRVKMSGHGLAQLNDNTWVVFTCRGRINSSGKLGIIFEHGVQTSTVKYLRLYLDGFENDRMTI